MGDFTSSLEDFDAVALSDLVRRGEVQPLELVENGLIELLALNVIE